MLQTGGGSIVNTASVSSLVASGPNLAAYMYTKAGVASITRAAACDYATRGIRVNAVAPAQVLTPLVERVIADAVDPVAEREARANRNPMPGFIMPSDVAAAVAFLASDDARFITGVVLPVDGGDFARSSSATVSAMRASACPASALPDVMSSATPAAQAQPSAAPRGSTRQKMPTTAAQRLSHAPGQIRDRLARVCRAGSPSRVGAGLSGPHKSGPLRTP